MNPELESEMSPQEKAMHRYNQWYAAEQELEPTRDEQRQIAQEQKGDIERDNR